MLRTLFAENFVTIARLEFELASGFVVFTGETGAGKSLLISVLSYVLGEKGDPKVIREGQMQSTLSASFDLKELPLLKTHLEDHGLLDGDDMVVRRILRTDGKGRAFVNERPVTMAFLKELRPFLLDIHGQFDNILTSDVQRELLDAYAQVQELSEKTKHAYGVYEAAVHALTAHHTAQQEAQKQQSFLEYCVQELSQAAPEAGEEAHLQEQRDRAKFRAKLEALFTLADEVMASGSGVEAQIGSLLQGLERHKDLLGPTASEIIEGMEGALVQSQEAYFSLKDVERSVLGDSMNLEALEDRYHLLKTLARKHACTIDELSALWEKLQAQLDLIDVNGADRKRLGQQCDEAKKAFQECAAQLTQERTRAARHLEKEVQQSLEALHLPHTRFEVVLLPLDEAHWSENGLERISFQVSMNMAQQLYPLMETASGGERNRLLLAIKSVLAKRLKTPTLCFDEIDVGMGGAAADAVGTVLRALSKDHQVLCVTHAPQVAAKADQHWKMTKTEATSGIQSQLLELNEEQRIEEMARMLSGAEVTAQARAAAQALLRGTT